MYLLVHGETVQRTDVVFYEELKISKLAFFFNGMNLKNSTNKIQRKEFHINETILFQFLF